MNINDMTKDVEQALKSYKKSDHMMIRKTFQMKDVLYRKSAPSHEVWRSEVAFDVNFCLLAAGAVLAAVIILGALSRMMGSVRSLSHKICHPRKK